ncbi:MAG: GAF domain-containing protein [Okeania sp. SIO3C4]|nr:GAF domain-containing protein [Okeania sp. SIO3C4]
MEPSEVETESGYLLVLGAYRDNEVSPAHSLIQTLNDIAKQSTPINTLTLDPLAQDDITRLTAETLLCSQGIAAPLAKLVYRKTRGNPFFTTQFLLGLHQDRHITLNAEAGYWQCDLAQVQQLSLTDDVVTFMVGRLQKLPDSTQDLLKLAAFIGNRFDLETLCIACNQTREDVATNLWSALQEGLIVPESETYKFFQGESETIESDQEMTVEYRFLHDRVQQAAYSLIPDEQKPAVHYRIGLYFLENFSEVEQEEALFAIVNHLNFGQSLLTEKSEQKRLAELNLRVGKKALSSVAYKAAIEYLETGIKLLESETWSSEYNLFFELYKGLCESYLADAEYGKLEDTIAIALNNISDSVDRIEFYILEIVKFVLEGNCEKSIEVGLIGLNDLGIDVDTENLPELISSEFSMIEQQMENRSISSLLELPTQVDRITAAKIKLLVTLNSPTYILGNFDLSNFVSLKATSLSVKYGNIDESIKAYASYGLFLNVVKAEYQRAYEFGKLAVDLSYTLNSKVERCKAGLFLGAALHVWAKPIQGAAQVNYDCFLAGTEAGEVQFSGYNLYCNILNRLFEGEYLSSIVEDINNYWLVAEKSKDVLLLCALAATRIFVQKLCLSADEYEQSASQLEAETIINENKELARTSVCFHYCLNIHSCYVLELFEESFEYFKKAGTILYAAAGYTTISNYYYYASLVLLQLYSSRSPQEKVELLEEVKTKQKQLKAWTESCPENFLHKYLLVEAECHRVLDDKGSAIEMYDRAIFGAKENGFTQEEALANELAAKFYLEWGKEKVAQDYMVEAYYCYARWGAKAKIDHLEATYPQLLTPILQQPNSILTLQTKTTLSSDRTLRTTSNANTSILDLSSAIKASQALSGEIELEVLLSQLMKIVLENAGADKAALILNNAGNWEIVAQCIEETCQLCLISLHHADHLPGSIVRNVQRTQKTITLNHGDRDTQFASDTYLIQQQPKSLFCTPILNQGQFIGILYLENNLSAGAFTQQRVEVLNLLCSQAAISIENARLYQQSQNYAKKLEGTVQELQQTQQQLQKSFEELKQAQLQLVQSEKMASIGQLTAGIAHEINNPLGFISGNFTLNNDYIQDIIELLRLYQAELSSPSEKILNKVEDIELDYLIEDLPKNIDSIEQGIKRITEISTSMRVFSRADTVAKVPFNIHEGIDSTLLILKHRLKASVTRPEIEVVKNYGNLPEVNCYPGQLNQVFMNLIANAIDALEESNLGKTFEEVEAAPNQIILTTEIDSENQQIIIRIRDNGMGMSESVKEKVFEHLFTTKGVGKGTGLGLSISRQIVEEKHGGKLTCNSSLGKGTEFVIALPR